MKKTYINPNMNVVTMKMTQHLLDGSITRTLDNTTTITDENDFGARGFDFDDEDEY